MTSLLLAWEDRYCAELDRALRRVLRRRHGKLHARREKHSVEGAGNFAAFVRERWPLFRDQGFPREGAPRMERLLCVIDADRVADAIPGIPPPPDGPTHTWVLDAEATFQGFLREKCGDSGEDVHGAVIRWSYESVIIAAHDHPASMEALGGLDDLDPARFGQFLETCQPRPGDVGDTAFTDLYRDPQGCLRDLGRRMGWARLKKGDPRKDQAVELFCDAYIDRVGGRVPDLARLADRVKQICG